jgi:hypothetical protein
MASNYPPGVTGNEPEITGEIEFDPHAPFWVGDDCEFGWSVFYRDEDDPMFTARSRKEAELFAEACNSGYVFRHEIRGVGGVCRVCGDLHGSFMDNYERVEGDGE